MKTKNEMSETHKELFFSPHSRECNSHIEAPIEFKDSIKYIRADVVEAQNKELKDELILDLNNTITCSHSFPNLIERLGTIIKLLEI